MFDKKEQGRWWDFGWQLVEGCTKISEGCENCWSLEKEKRFKINHPNVTFMEDRLKNPYTRKKPTSYAIWNDLFHESISFEQIDKVFAIISRCPQHIFLILTKRPERMLEYYKEWGNIIKNVGFDSVPSESENPLDYMGEIPNVWLGVTVENQEMADKRIPILLEIPAKVRFVSVEPMINAVDLKYIKGDAGSYYQVLEPITGCNDGNRPRLDWVICGGESGHNARPMHPDWVRNLNDQCEKANVPFYFKQWGKKSSGKELDGKTYLQIPEILY